MDGQSIKILNNSFDLDTDLLNYCNIRRNFLEFYYDSLYDIYDIQNQEIDDIDTWISSIGFCAKRKINDALLLSSDIVVSFGEQAYSTSKNAYFKNDVDVNQFNKHRIVNNEIIWYDRLFNINESLEFLENQCENINNLQATAEIKRQNRNSNVSHWIGGGFGVSGALKGVAIAGAMNLGSSIFRGIGNSIANSWDSANVSNAKKNIIKSVRKDNYIIKAYEECILGIFQMTIWILEDAGKLKESEFNFKKAEQLYNIIKNEPKKQEIFECIKLYPFEFHYYQYVLENYGKCDGAVKELAEAYGIGMHYDAFIDASIAYLDAELKNHSAEQIINSNPCNVYFYEFLQDKLSPNFISKYINCSTYDTKCNDEYMTALDFISMDEEIQPEIKQELDGETLNKKGIEFYLNGNYVKAAKFFKEATQKGDEDGTYNLFKLYGKDRANILHNYKKDCDRYVFADDLEAVNWFSSIPVEENPMATFYAAYILRWGFVGDKDYKWYNRKDEYMNKAMDLFLKCHQIGYTKATNMIGYMLYAKEYVSKSVDSYTTAAKYFQYVINNSTNEDDILNAKNMLSTLKNKNNRWVKIFGAKIPKSAGAFLPKSNKRSVIV